MLKKIPFHTFLLAMYFPLALLASNLGEVKPKTALRPILFMALATAAILLLLFLFLRDIRTSGLLASILVVIFSVYGLLYTFFKSVSVLNPIFGRHRLLVGLLLAIIAFFGWFISRKLKHIHNATLIMNLFALYLLAMPLVQLIIFSFRSEQDAIKKTQLEVQVPVNPQNVDDTPDIYYLILDAYDRGDYLASEFGYDNSAFLDSLSNAGFFVADCSRSNYAHTFLSLSSTLNMGYIEDFTPEGDLTINMLKDLLIHSRTRAVLGDLGYQIVAFDNVHWDFSDADTFYKFDTHPLTHPYLFRMETVLVDNSILKLVKDLSPWFQQRINAFASSAVKDHFLLQEYLLDSLDNSVSLRSPKFVFAHIEKPHGPYVFEPDGAFIEEDAFYRDKYFAAINQDYDRAGYIKQVEYINRRVLALLSQLDGNAVVIIQGDHGIQEIDDLNARLGILYAVYLPGQDYSHFYSSITPVNTFRIILDQLFSADLGLLEDQSYYSYREYKLDYFPVSESMSGCLHP